MMWGAISYVSSGITLVAFCVATAAWIYKRHTDQTERLIRAARPTQRAQLVRNALEFFNIETENLSQDQQYQLAIAQISERANRFKYVVFTVGFLSIVASAVAIYAIGSDYQNHRMQSTPAIPPNNPAAVLAKLSRYSEVYAYDQGYFVRQGSAWTEINLTTEPMYQYSEFMRNVKTVIIYDDSRDTYIRIPTSGGLSLATRGWPPHWEHLYELSKKSFQIQASNSR